MTDDIGLIERRQLKSSLGFDLSVVLHILCKCKIYLYMHSIPLQCSCLENPRDGGAWWAAGYGVAQSRTRLKRLSSSSRIRSRTASTLYLFRIMTIYPTNNLQVPI